MTFIDTASVRSRRFSLSQSRPVQAVLMVVAVLQARMALARIVRNQRPRGVMLAADLPNYLRRDIGLPEVQARPWDGLVQHLTSRIQK